MAKDELVEIKQVPICGRIEVRLKKTRFWRDPISMWYIRKKKNGETKLTPNRWSSSLKRAIKKGTFEIVDLHPDCSRFTRLGTYTPIKKEVKKIEKQKEEETSNTKGTSLIPGTTIIAPEKLKITKVITKPQDEVVEDDK